MSPDFFPLIVSLMRLLFLVLSLGYSTGPLLAMMGDTPEQSVVRYGKPERDAMRQSGLLCFRKDGLCVIAHYHGGRCDVLSLFSSEEEFGFPKELGDDRIHGLLRHEGGDAGWEALPGFTINKVWDSADGRMFAIYDTMRHKLVIMSREAYRREKEAKKEAQKETRPTLGRESSISAPHSSP